MMFLHICWLTGVLVICFYDGYGANAKSLTRRDVANTSLVVHSFQNEQTDVKISMEADMPWEIFLIPAPTVISLLGQLMVLSGKVDFSLTENTPNGGFKYIRHPSSFRATLVQVSNDGWVAFMNAHKNMDRIQLYMLQVPDHIKTTLKLVIQGSLDIVQRLLPITLTHIKEIGTECVKLASETEKKFIDVMLLLGEILESTEVSRRTHDAKLLAAQIELNTSMVHKQNLENIDQELRKRQAQVDAEVKKYQDAYDKALRDIPTGWNAILQDVVRAGINVINIGTQFGGKSSGGGSFGSGSMGNQQSSPDFQMANVMSIMQQYGGQLIKIKDEIQQVFSQESGSANNPAGMFSAYIIVLNMWENLLSSAGPSGQNSLQLVKDGQVLCSKMENLLKDAISTNISDEVKTEINEYTDDLIEKVKPMGAASAYMSNGMSMTSGAISPSTFSGKHGDERFKAYMNLELLQDSQRRSDKIFDDIMKYQEEMKKLMTRMATLNMETINFRDIIDLIKEGIIILSNIRAQWSKLIEFFSMFSVRAEIMLSQKLLPFVRMSDEAKNGMADFDRQLIKEILQKQAADILVESFFLHTLSSTYVDVSSRFLLTRLAGIAKMLATSEEQERQSLLLQLNNQSEEAENEIKRLSTEKRSAYKRLVKQRIDEVNVYVQQLGGPTESDRIAAQKGINAIKNNQVPTNPFDIDLNII